MDKLRLGEDIYDGSNRVFKAWQPLSKDLLEKLASRGVTTGIPVPRSRRKHQKTHRRLERNGARLPGNYEKRIFTVCRRTKPPPSPNARRRWSPRSRPKLALPNILRLTNEISQALSNTTRLTANLNVIAENVRPVITNLTVISKNLRNPKGALGEWLITSRPISTRAIEHHAEKCVNGTLTNANTNIVVTIDNLNRSLDNLADLTGNLDRQVQANPTF